MQLKDLMKLGNADRIGSDRIGPDRAAAHGGRVEVEAWYSAAAPMRRGHNEPELECATGAADPNRVAMGKEGGTAAVRRT